MHFQQMIKLQFLITLLIISVTLPAQRKNQAQVTIKETDYWSKYKRQQFTAGSMLGGGLLLIVISSKIRNSSMRDGTYYSNQFWPNTIMLTGGLSMTVSIPFFFSAAKNKGRALRKRSNQAFTSIIKRYSNV